MASQDTDISNSDITTRSMDIINKFQPLLELLSDQNKLQNLIDENPELNQQLDELNSALCCVSEKIELSGDQRNKVFRCFEKVLNEAEKNSLFKMKSQSLIDTLCSNQLELQVFFDDNPNSDAKFNDLFALLGILSSNIKYLNEPELILSILIKKKTINEIISGVITTMDKINEELRHIGVQNPTRLPSNNVLQDYLQIYDSIDNWINMFEKRKKEITITLNQCSSNNLRNESIKQILDQYGDYRQDKGSFRKDDFLYYCFWPFEYYNGKDVINGDPVLLTELKDNKYLGRILEVLTQLDHEYVESFIGFYVENEDENNEPEITIVTKRVGIDLFSFLHPSDKTMQKMYFESGDRTIYAYKIAQAMSYVHSHNIIHRNLSTSSIYISKEKGQDPDPMIVDFRSSSLMLEKVDLPVRFRNRFLFGCNPSNFIAPEFENSSQYDEKIDVFSFAAIIYELATGEPPFGDYDENVILAKLKNNERPAFPKEVNPDLVELINHCWEQDPTKRYTFNQVMKDMVQKNIIVDKYIEKEEHIKEFYQKSNSYSNKISSCISLIENTKKDIMKSCQYKHILFGTRSLLNQFQSFLLHEYDQQSLDNDEEIDKIDNLIDNLQQFTSVVAKTLPDNWCRMAPTLEVDKFIKHIQTGMKAILHSIKELGFQGDDDYQESKDDLISDLRELFMAYEKFDNKTVSRDKCKEITKYLRKIDPNCLKEIKNPSKQQTYEKIVNVFSNFSKYEFSCHDFVQNFEVQRGKNSTVYEGYKAKDGKPVVIKEFNGNELGKSERNLFNLRREIEYLTKVDHKYIANFVGYAINPDNNNVMLVTELAKSGTMNQMLNKTISHLTGTEKTILSFKLADAMAYLNSKQIIHRGLTTSNIVIEGKRPKLIDFGNASPEIKGIDRDPYDNPSLDDVEYDTKDDVFTFSMILYEMLTGEVPQGPNYGFNIDEDKKSDLQKLIELGFQPANQDSRSFAKIRNKMINDRISFPDSNMDEVYEFYDKKIGK